MKTSILKSFLKILMLTALLMNIAKARDPFFLKIKPKESKQSIEIYDLTQLLLLGTLKVNDKYWALIKAPSGEIYQLTVGDNIGPNKGKLISIKKNKIIIAEAESALMHQIKMQKNLGE